MSLPGPEKRRQKLDELKATWSRCRVSIFTSSIGCGCGFGGLILQAADFELDIVEFLLNEARKAATPNLEAFVAAAGRGTDRYSLPALFDALVAAQDNASIVASDTDFAIARLSKPSPILRLRIVKAASHVIYPAIEAIGHPPFVR